MFFTLLRWFFKREGNTYKKEGNTYFQTVRNLLKKKEGKKKEIYLPSESGETDKKTLLMKGMKVFFDTKEVVGSNPSFALKLHVKCLQCDRVVLSFLAKLGTLLI